MDLYYDRNMVDSIIGPTIHSIEIYFKTNKLPVNKVWGKLNKKNKINVHWGVLCKHKRDTFFRDTLMKRYKYNIIIEQGFLNRKYYRSFGINGFAGLSQKFPTNCPDDRFKKLNINIKDMKINKNGYILICGQLPWDTQVQDIDYNKWLNDLFIKLKKTNKKIVYRNHPLYKPRGKHIITVPDFITMDENEKLIDSIKNAYCCLSYNSTSLVEAIIEGCPIIPYSKMSVVYNLSSKDINNLYIPSKKEIYQTMCNISYIQYTEEEWSNGVAFNYIKSLL